ncbi:MAG: hypothetical protein H7Y06_00025 [Opitutaceae bacterium]|nr:hypothetical protein [Opitutaceae bacterium]
MAVSDDLKTWRRHSEGPLIDNPRPADLKPGRGAISSDRVHPRAYPWAFQQPETI